MFLTCNTVPITPILPSYSPGAAQEPAAYGAGAGRSARGLPILWESPAAEDLRGGLVEGVAQGSGSAKGALQASGHPPSSRGGETC